MTEIVVTVELGGGTAGLTGGGVLHVRVQDVSLMDAPARTLAARSVPIPPGGVLPGRIALDFAAPADGPERYAASAVLNLGWTPSGAEWLRPGDWLSTTEHPVRPGDRAVAVRLERYDPGR
ncbi:hypothetical protein ACIRBX_23005 [Kitasatospora sp. NPDC096147]|uniref:hypothetical protein n=1 Tax=Kitasatospora sp. NPDC096147 TaxID=3364093 RepID=UPI00382FB207